MHLSLCLCAELPRLRLPSRLCLVMHRDETRKTTNTGRLAALCLQGTEIVLHGRRGERAEAPDRALPSLLLFPCPEAVPLGPEHAADGPVRLVVPDGTWRQAAKMSRRIPWFGELPRVSLPEGDRTRYRLRTESRSGGLSTIEAIARAFGILEGPGVQAQLERVSRMMVERTLFSRGDIPRERVFGGVPADAVMHDPGRNADAGRERW